MKYSLCLLVVSALATAYPGKKVPAPGPDGRYTLEAPGIRAQVPYPSFLVISLLMSNDFYLELALLGIPSHDTEL
jgi:hypothetical protein